MLTLTLLGSFQAHIEGRSDRLRLPTQKAMALLAHLALRDAARVPRDFLAALLWNDVPLPQGRHSLRQELTHIRTAIGPGSDVYLQADRNTVSLRLERVQVDADRLIELVNRHTPESMKEACDLYRGQLLTGLQTREQAFDAWLASARADINRLAVIAFEYRLDHLTDAEGDEAVILAQKLIAIDHSNETALRWLGAAGSFVESPAGVPSGTLLPRQRENRG